jgi:hypothetical protein
VEICPAIKTPIAGRLRSQSFASTRAMSPLLQPRPFVGRLSGLVATLASGGRTPESHSTEPHSNAQIALRVRRDCFSNGGERLKANARWAGHLVSMRVAGTPTRSRVGQNERDGATLRHAVGAEAPVNLEHILKKRPWVFHQTAPQNLHRIRRVKQLVCAGLLMKQAGHIAEPAPRPQPLWLNIDTEPVIIRDQAPLLRARQMMLEPGFTMSELVQMLDAHVYFWLSATESFKPQGVGVVATNEARLRIPLADLLAVNDRGPLFCRYNSGGPRAYDGRGSPRGPDLFAPPSRSKS